MATSLSTGANRRTRLVIERRPMKTYRQWKRDSTGSCRTFYKHGGGESQTRGEGVDSRV